MKLKNIFATVLTGVLFFASVPNVNSHAVNYIPQGAVASVTVNNETSYYYNNTTSGGAEAMWNTAMTGTSAMIVLYQDWVSSYGTRFGTGTGFAFDGVLCVPSGHEITIDLNGCSINRNLEFAIENGEVIHVQNGGVLNLTDTNTELGNSGTITGGNSLDGAGGIYVETGGTVNMWGGNITGNKTESSGGGVLLVGEESNFSMSGGTIANNTASQCGGGIALSGGNFKLANGTVSDNRSQSGGGIYAQAGTVELSGGSLTQNVAVHGGGILVNNTAELTLRSTASVQNNIASGENRLGGGILAMSSMPIHVSGKINITENSADGVQSNLVFWQDSESDTGISCYLQDAGLESSAKIGVSVSNKIKKAVFAPAWSGVNCFDCDAMDYKIESKNNDMMLCRMTSYATLVGDKTMRSIILVAVLVALAFIAILALVFKKSKTSEESSEISENPEKKKVKVAKRKSSEK
ncbi:MAG: hypothetical protein K2O52_04875 [Oscillospiraceae bacterium]|nr:hypothetical protein [Oscillospiraceae bacterium]